MSKKKKQSYSKKQNSKGITIVVCLLLAVVVCFGVFRYTKKDNTEPNVQWLGSTLALMDVYYPNIQKTCYSGTTITQMQVEVAQPGTMTVGTVPVNKAAKAKGVMQGYYSDNAQTFNVKTGVNVLELNLPVSESETIAIGGYQDTAAIAKRTDKLTTGTEIQGWIEASNKLNIQVKAQIEGSITSNLTPGNYEEESNGSIGTGDVVSSAAPFAFQNLTLFSGKTITQINVPIASITNRNNAFFTVYVVPATATGAAALTNAHQIHLPASFVSSFSTAAWCHIDLTQDGNSPIEVPDGYTLAFGAKSGDTAVWKFAKSSLGGYCVDSRTFYTRVSDGAWGKDTTVTNLIFDIFCTESYNLSFTQHMENLASAESEAAAEAAEQAQALALKKALAGKNISFLGDSITTYEGISNNTSYNSTIGSNAVWYNSSKGLAVDDLWWMQLVNDYNMNLCVNNSWSGSKVTGSASSSCGWNTRPEQLHNNSNVNPDIIVVYLGINDFNANVTCGNVSNYAVVEANGFTPSNFAEAYTVMIHKIVVKYGNAKVFCCTLPDTTYNENDTLLAQYNSTIQAVANHYGCYVADLFANSGLDDTTYAANSIDNLHPNANGMDLMTNCIVETMKATLVK